MTGTALRSQSRVSHGGRSPSHRARRRSLRGARRVLSAVTGQVSQALASFVLQLVAARALGAEGLGTFALLYSGAILCSSVVAGFVGDSLTVLDRSARPIRAALQNWCVLLCAGTGFVAAALAVGTGLVEMRSAILFGLATAVFMVESTVRRLLMACMRFWAVSVCELSGLLGSVAVLAGWARGDGRLTLDSLLVALLVGQFVAALVALGLAPASERRLVGVRSAAMLEVGRYAIWRAGQKAVRPSMLTLSRVLITVVVGTAMYGQLEAARVYMAPALLVVNGIGSLLLPTYVANRARPMRHSLRRADTAAAALFVATLAIGAIATVAVPQLGTLVTGDSYRIDQLAVFGWAVYAASCGAVMPYGTLAAVRRRQAVVLGLRVLDSALSVGLVLTLLSLSPGSVSWAPFALSIGSFAGGLLVRSIVLRPLVTRPERALIPGVLHE